ncbi:PREDICTED: uncharacterized protein LOC108689662, partial [Atta colombica]|uniref:uncharacterized protein LOC108689662 n=1 Tax=Atta colombica TaxID=520822 RepID=UPI00084C7BA5
MEKYMEIYGEKHQTKRLIMDLTEEDVDIISISSQEGTQNQTMDNNKYASPERREVSMVEKRSPVLTTNRGINRVLYYPTLEIKEELQETIHEKHSENNKSDEVEEDLSFSKHQSKDTQKEEQLVQSLTKEIENWINIQKSKSKRIENLKAICPNSIELLSKTNNNNDLEINKTLEPINKLVNHNNSGNEVTRQFDLDTTKLDRTTTNPIIESKIGDIRHKVSQKNTCITKQIDDKNKVNNCKVVIVQRYGKVVRRFIKVNNRTLKYLGLTNFLLRTDKKFQINVIRRLKRKQKVSRANQLMKKALIRKRVTKLQAVTRKMTRRQPKSIPTTEEKNEIKINNIRRMMETSSETSSSDIGRQLEKDEKTLLQKLKNELKIKEEIVLRIKRIKHMREIIQQLEKENIRYKAVDKQTGQQLEITRTIDRYHHLKNESTEYKDNFIIKDQAECDTSHVKIKDLRLEGYRGPQIFQTKYLMEDHLTRHVAMVHTNDSTQQVEQLPVVKIKPSTSRMADENKKELSEKKRK